MGSLLLSTESKRAASRSCYQCSVIGGMGYGFNISYKVRNAVVMKLFSSVNVCKIVEKIPVVAITLMLLYPSILSPYVKMESKLAILAVASLPKWVNVRWYIVLCKPLTGMWSFSNCELSPFYVPGLSLGSWYV